MLGREADVFRHALLAQTVAIRRPFVWQIQAIRHRQARMAVGKRQGYDDLAVIFLAKLAPIFPSNANRGPPLVWKARIVNDPRFDRSVPLYRWQHHLANLG